MVIIVGEPISQFSLKMGTELLCHVQLVSMGSCIGGVIIQLRKGCLNISLLLWSLVTKLVTKWWAGRWCTQCGRIERKGASFPPMGRAE